MKKIFLTLVIMLGLTASAYAASPNDAKANSKPMSAKKIRKMDHRLTKHKAVKRNFKSRKEFTKRRQNRMRRQHRATSSKRMRYDNGYNYEAPATYREPYRPIRQRGYRNAKKGWILAFQYDRASFYDNGGYFYGYFNRSGYYFEDVFYRFDRYYTYRDRARGRSLFDRRYYMPSNANYYGLCNTGYNDDRRHTNYDDRHRTRGYDRD